MTLSLLASHFLLAIYFPSVPSPNTTHISKVSRKTNTERFLRELGSRYCHQEQLQGGKRGTAGTEGVKVPDLGVCVAQTSTLGMAMVPSALSQLRTKLWTTKTLPGAAGTPSVSTTAPSWSLLFLNSQKGWD